jgi:hypothetical protein
VLPLDVVVDGVVVVVAVVVVVPWIAALTVFAWFELECDAAIAAPPPVRSATAAAVAAIVRLPFMSVAPFP